jgi:iron complex outermembrane receptor protein
MKRLPVVVLLLLLPLPLAAQDPGQASSEPEDDPQAQPPHYEETVDVEAELPAIPPSAAAATRVPVPVESLPVSVSVVPRSVFVEQDAFVLSDALKNASGVNPMPGFGVFDFFVVRGFDSLSGGLVAVDGAPEPEATFYPLYNVRQLEVLKGPASFLYGGNPLAAAVHVVRKQPGPGRFAEGSLAYGRYGTFAATADGNLAKADGSLGLRLSGVWQGTDGYRDGQDGSLRAINPTVAWRPDDQSRVVLGFEYLRSEAQPDTGIPFVGDELAPVPRTRSYQSPLDESDQDLYRVRLDAERRFGDKLTLRNKLYFTDLTWDSDGTLVLGAFPGPQGLLVGRVLTILDDRQKLLGDQLEASLTFKTGGVGHQLLAGVELYRLRDTFTQDVAFIPPIDLLDPVEFTQAPVTTQPQLAMAGDSRSLVLAPYVVDRIAFSEKATAFAGARLDHLDYEDPANQTERSATELSPICGIVYAPTPRLSFYVSGGTAFAPPSTQVVGARDPEQGNQVEVGAKTTFLGGKGYAALAVYHLTRENIAIPDTTGRTSQSGDQRSRGVELDFSAQLGAGWVSYASYAFTDAEFTQFAELVALPTPPFFAVLDRSGNRPGFAPRHLASVWSSKTFRDRLTIAAGARLVSEQFIHEDNAFKVDSYATLDAAASYRLGRARFSLNFKNLTGTEYETRGFGAAAAVPARPFEMLARIELAVGGR